MADDQKIEQTTEVDRDLVNTLTDQTPVTKQEPVDVSKYEQQIAELQGKLEKKQQIADSLLSEEIDGREALNRIARLADKSDEEIASLLKDIERNQQTEPTQAGPKDEPVDIDEKVRKMIEEREGDIDKRFKQTHETNRAFATQMMDSSLEKAVESSEDFEKWHNVLKRNAVSEEALEQARKRFENRVEERAQYILRNKKDEVGSFELKWIPEAYQEAAKYAGEEVRTMVGGAYDKIGAASDVVSKQAAILSEPELELPDFSKGNPRDTKDAFKKYIEQSYARDIAGAQQAKSASKA